MFGVLRPSSAEGEDSGPGMTASLNTASTSTPTSMPPPPAPRSLAPMPSTEFPTREELLSSVKDWCAHQGFAVVIARSRFNRLWLKCDRGGTYENRRGLMPDERKRKRGDSRLLGCPFKAVASFRRKSVWCLETEIPDHNHGPSDDLSQHPTLRRMDDEQLAKVHQMCDDGHTPSETMEELKRVWPEINVLTRDIYNARKKHKTELEMEAQGVTDPSQLRPPIRDPNGIIPGPGTRGRWEWVPDGEKVTNNRGRKRRKTAPAVVDIALDQSLSSAAAATAAVALDPQLQDTNALHTPIHHPTSSTDQQLLDSFPHHHNDPSAYSEPAAFPRVAQSTSSNRTANMTGYNQTRYSTESEISPSSRLRSHTATASANTNINTTYIPHPSPSTAAAVSNPNNIPSTASGMISTSAPVPAPASTPAGAKLPSGQVLMSRIERMEKEQRDQKNMLAQILGAVQGFDSSPA